MCAATLDPQHIPGRGGPAKASEPIRRGGRRRVDRGRHRLRPGRCGVVFEVGTAVDGAGVVRFKS